MPMVDALAVSETRARLDREAAIRSSRRRRYIFNAVEAERERQDKKWGGYERDVRSHTYGVVLGEEFGEVCQATLEQDTLGLRDELIQVAAVAVAWVEMIDRQLEEAVA